MAKNIKKITLKSGKVRWQARAKINGQGVFQTFDMKTDAEVWKRKIETEKHSKRSVNHELLVTTINEVLDWTETDVPHRLLAKSSRYNFPRIRKLIGHAQIAQLNQKSLDNFVNALEKSKLKDNETKISKDTFRRAYYAFKRAIELWSKHNSYPLSCEFNHKLEAGWANVIEVRISDEESALLKETVPKALKTRHDIWPKLMDFLICTGLRLQEVFRAELSDISKDGVLTVWADDTKTKKDRHIQLTEDALEIIDELPKIESRLFDFPSTQSIEKQFLKIRERSGLKHITLHCFRHEYTSRLVEETDLSHAQIMAMTGHKNIKTYQRYYNLRPDKIAPKLKSTRLARRQPSS